MSKDVRELIRQTSLAHPRWGASRGLRRFVGFLDQFHEPASFSATRAHQHMGNQRDVLSCRYPQPVLGASRPPPFPTGQTARSPHTTPLGKVGWSFWQVQAATRAHCSPVETVGTASSTCTRDRFERTLRAALPKGRRSDRGDGRPDRRVRPPGREATCAHRGMSVERVAYDLGSA